MLTNAYLKTHFRRQLLVNDLFMYMYCGWKHPQSPWQIVWLPLLIYWELVNVENRKLNHLHCRSVHEHVGTCCSDLFNCMPLVTGSSSIVWTAYYCLKSRRMREPIWFLLCAAVSSVICSLLLKYCKLLFLFRNHACPCLQISDWKRSYRAVPSTRR